MTEHFSTDFLVDYVHGELSPEGDALAHAHLVACAACRREYDAEVALGEMLRSAAAADEREMPSLVNAAVWERVRAARPGPLASIFAYLRPGIAVPLAALLLLGGLGGFFASPFAHRSNPPTIAASYYLQSHALQAAQTPLSERAGTQVYEASIPTSNQAAVADAYDGGYPATGALNGGR